MCAWATCHALVALLLPLHCRSPTGFTFHSMLHLKYYCRMSIPGGLLRSCCGVLGLLTQPTCRSFVPRERHGWSHGYLTWLLYQS